MIIFSISHLPLGVADGGLAPAFRHRHVGEAGRGGGRQRRSRHGRRVQPHHPVVGVHAPGQGQLGHPPRLAGGRPAVILPRRQSVRQVTSCYDSLKAK